MSVRTVKFEGADLVPDILAAGLKCDAVLKLAEISVLIESMTVVRRGGRLCQAGWLGGLGLFVEFNP